MIALTSATGKLGSAVLDAILEHSLADRKELIVCTTDPTNERFNALHKKNITPRYHNFDEPESLERAYTGCTKLFLVSTPRIEMDYNDAPLWKGREAHHRAAIDAAVKVGVKHIYYTSLAFGNPSKAGVMRAHIRTEQYLRNLAEQGKVEYTIIREGLYNESWPLYFGYYWTLRKDERKVIYVAGDGPISWTAISDMAFATAKIVTAPSEEWIGKTLYLSQSKTCTLDDIARVVSRLKAADVSIKTVSRKEFEDHYVNEMGMERASVEWWSSTYDALKDGECQIKDSTLEDILTKAGKTPKPMEGTIEEMMG
ncbi:NAD(P)-binding protein [Lentithecium fluviatile CBS 122367]|uniref:NAD(P)-binding protein n=1 Tax=Lentithecium fluviatile CBS 122367 TaxID=1168545 RepID=A0A6G1IK62_9PLEO|nr:NAD(P)-binding protein [Lentithecium fluviatile CBS 122367]